MIQQMGFAAKRANATFRPLMYILAGTVWEEPPQTYPWNLERLRPRQIQSFDRTPAWMVPVDAATGAVKLGVRSHMPVFGGWRDYVVLEPVEYVGEWYIGWIRDVVEASRTPLQGRVRMRRGDLSVLFFGTTKNGTQIRIRLVGEGRIGEGGLHAQVPLL